MKETDQEKVQVFLEHYGMFLSGDNLTEAIQFVYAMGYWIDGEPLAGFFDWLIENYFDDSYRQEYSSRGWGHLIDFLPECSSDDADSNISAFLAVVRRFLSETGQMNE